MSKKEGKQRESRQSFWKGVGCSAAAALGVYALLQFANAALVSGEVVGEGKAWVLVWCSAGIALLVGVLVMGRGVRTQRLLLGAGSTLAFTAGLVMLAAASGNRLADMGGAVLGILVAALVGGSLAAVLTGKKKLRRGRKR